MKPHLKIPTPIQPLNHPLFSEKGIHVSIKRDDLIHPEISGNKWRKLRLNVEKYKVGKYRGILTFGGAYSNHIAATASAGNILGIPTTGIIRGDELSEDSNETLKRAAEKGMQLIFTSREEYALRYEKYYHEELRRRYGNVWIVDEGGANYYGVLGCVDIIKEIDEEPDYIITASGTGTTAAGLLLGTENTKVISIPVLKGGGFIRNEIGRLLKITGTDEAMDDYLSRLILLEDYHFGGYGKFTDELIDFINQSYKEFEIPFDQIYTGKMFYALVNLVEKGYFESGSNIVALHTGGLQGLSTITKKIEF